jgi:hypothetical protein
MDTSRPQVTVRMIRAYDFVENQKHADFEVLASA